MKPEPLKNKIFKKCTGSELFFASSIKSAVEWLGEEDTFDKAKFLQADIDIKELFKRLDENRNKAFEDVIKDSNKYKIVG